MCNIRDIPAILLLSLAIIGCGNKDSGRNKDCKCDLDCPKKCFKVECDGKKCTPHNNCKCKNCKCKGCHSNTEK